MWLGLVKRAEPVSLSFPSRAAAIAAGRKLAHRLFQPGATATQSYDDVPSVVFSHPPAGTCGLTEEDAVAKFGADKVKIYKTRFVNMYHGASGRAGDEGALGIKEHPSTDPHRQP